MILSVPAEHSLEGHGEGTQGAHTGLAKRRALQWLL